MKDFITCRLSIMLMMAMVASVSGEQSDGFAQDVHGAKMEPVFQMGVAVGLRLDDLNKYTYVPSIGGRFHYFFHPMVALHGGLSYNSLTRLDPGTSYHTVAGDVGLRVNMNHAQVVPFLETGFSFPYYWGVNRGYEYVDFHPGVRIGAGLAWRVSKKLAFDLSVIQVVNHWRTQTDFILGIPAPCPPDVECPPLRQEPDGAYNPTLMELVVRFGL